MNTPATLYVLLKNEFQNLSEEQILKGYNKVLRDLLKLRKDWSKAEAQNFIDETLTKLLNTPYRMRFARIMYEINPQGLALSKSFTKNLKREMKLQWSIWNYFNKLDYDHSSMKQFVHNARRIQMPSNSKFTLTR